MANIARIQDMSLDDAANDWSTVNRKFRELTAGVFPADFYGRNTGADFAPQIQAALDAANAAGGGLVLLRPRQSYRIDTRLTIYANTTLEGMGATITLDSNADRGFLVSGSNVTIKNVNIDCAYEGAGITASNDKDNLTVEGVEILNPSSTGIASTNCSYFTARRCKVYWDAAGVTARVSAGNALYGITSLVTTDGYQTVQPLVEDCEVDFTAFTASQMESVDACILIRGDEVNSTYVPAVRPQVIRAIMKMPVGERGVTYGSGLPRPTGVEIRTANDALIDHSYTSGGDLTNSFGRITRGTINAPHVASVTHYGVELAQDCRECSVIAPNINSALFLQGISVTDCAAFSVTGGMVQGGDTSDSDCIRLEGADTTGTITGTRIVPTATGSDGIALVNGAEAVITGTFHFGSPSGAGGHIHIQSGTIPNVQVTGATFEGVAVRPVKVTATVTHLGVGMCSGLGSPLASDLTTGTVSNRTFFGNYNLTNLATSITTADIANNAVTTAKILDGQVLAADLAADAVTTAKILDNAVTTDKIA